MTSGPSDSCFAVRIPPTGYVVGAKGKWLKSPDAQVRHAIEQLFPDYLRLGSAAKVAAHYRQQNLKLPARRPGREVEWKPPERGQ